LNTKANGKSLNDLHINGKSLNGKSPSGNLRSGKRLNGNSRAGIAGMKSAAAKRRLPAPAAALQA
jgi:hypothetical protein